MSSTAAILTSSTSTARKLPPPPSRNQLLGGRSVFQGVTAHTQQYGTFPAFGPELNMLDLLADRQGFYAAQKAAGTSVCQIGWAGSTYSEPGFTFPVPGPEMRWVNDIPGFCDRLAEILTVGQFTGILLMLPGDGHTEPGYPYGYEFVMSHISTLIAAMKAYPGGDLTEYTIFCPGYDGVVWVWTEDQIMAYGNLLRGLLPNGYLALEYGGGILGPFGEGKAQYDDQLRIFDLFLQETSYPPFSNMDQIWQIFARMVGPKYIRPPDQPPTDDPGSPFAAGSGNDYTSNGTPRGPYFYWPWEFATYGWVRGYCDLTMVEQWRQYLATCAGHSPSVG